MIDDSMAKENPSKRNSNVVFYRVFTEFLFVFGFFLVSGFRRQRGAFNGFFSDDYRVLPSFFLTATETQLAALSDLLLTNQQSLLLDFYRVLLLYTGFLGDDYRVLPSFFLTATVTQF